MSTMHSWNDDAPLEMGAHALVARPQGLNNIAWGRPDASGIQKGVLAIAGPVGDDGKVVLDATFYVRHVEQPLPWWRRWLRLVTRR